MGQFELLWGLKESIFGCIKNKNKDADPFRAQSRTDAEARAAPGPGVLSLRAFPHLPRARSAPATEEN